MLDLVEHMLRHMRCEQRRVDTVKTTADEALNLGRQNSTRLDALEGQRRTASQEILTALAFSKMAGLPTDLESVKRLGTDAARFARRISIKPVRVPDPRYRSVNGFPVWLWELTTKGPESVAS